LSSPETEFDKWSLEKRKVMSDIDWDDEGFAAWDPYFDTLKKADDLAQEIQVKAVKAFTRLQSKRGKKHVASVVNVRQGSIARRTWYGKRWWQPQYGPVDAWRIGEYFISVDGLLLKLLFEGDGVKTAEIPHVQPFEPWKAPKAFMEGVGYGPSEEMVVKAQQRVDSLRAAIKAL
jgi:hypothetical protein